jgi:hypothetical protein
VFKVGLVGLVCFSALNPAATASAGQGRHGHDSPPSPDDIAFARSTALMLADDLFAALAQQSAVTVPENVAQGNLALSLLFDSSSYRLVGDIDPIDPDNEPRDSFERQSLELALTGADNEAVERVRGKYYFRRSAPLSNVLDGCGVCHGAYGPRDPGEWVGTMIVRVPIER